MCKKVGVGQDKFHIIDFKELNGTQSLLISFEETIRLVEKRVSERLHGENGAVRQFFLVALYQSTRFLVRAAFALFLFGEIFSEGITED
jgi:hypothetical protein